MTRSLLLVTMLSACGSGQLPARCSDASLAKLSGLHAAELVAACAEYGSIDACPAELRGPVDDAAARRYSEWEECR